MKKTMSILIVSGVLVSITNNVYAGYFINDAKKACPQILSSYSSFGNSSDEVLFMQNELKREGYFREIPTGYFDYSTVDALKQFQRDNDLLQSGKVGENTLNYLNERICGFSISGGSIRAVGTTVVSSYDPFVKVINAETDKYVATQNSTQAGSNSDIKSSLNVSNILPSASLSNINNINVLNNPISVDSDVVGLGSANISVIMPATLINQSVTNANVIYNPFIGYTYGITPKAGSITMLSPGVNSVFHEGDVIKASWYSTNLNVYAYQVLLENTNTGRSKEVLVTLGTEASFTLTKELLDYLCFSTCDVYQQGNFQLSVATPFKDMAGNITTLKTRVYPITIKRDIYSISNARISVSKNPVSSDETFSLYVDISNPSIYWNNSNKYTFSVSAVCPAGVLVSIAGMNCGQEFSMPQLTQTTSKQLPVKVTNNGWFTQGVVFNLSVYDDLGRLTGTASTTTMVNPKPMSF